MGVKTCLWSELEIKQCPGQVCSKNKAKIVACELFKTMHIFSFIRYKIPCLEIIFSNAIKSKEV